MSKYLVYFTKQQKKLLSIYTIICFMIFVFPNIISAPTFGTEINRMYNLVEGMFRKVSFILVPMMIVLPIFSFRFLLNKKTVDVYYTIPISKKELFRNHYFATLIMAIIPPFIMMIISYFILVIYSYVHFDSMVVWILWTFVIFTIFLSIYALVTFVIMKTNNVIDAVIISISYIIVPMIAVSAIDTFLLDQALFRDMLIFEWIDQILYFVSPLSLLAQTISYFSFNFATYSANSVNWFFCIYSIAMFIGFTYLAQKAFLTKKGEDAEQITTHFLTYPLIMNVLSICLISFVKFKDDVSLSIVTMTLIFMIYAILNFIAAKSIKINAKLFIKFAIFILLFNGFSYVSRQTEFFGMNRKLIDADKIDRIEIKISTYGEKNDEWNDYYVYVNNVEEQSEIVELLNTYQLYASKIFKNKNKENFYSPKYSSLEIEYNMKDGSEKSRYYHYFTEKELAPIISLSEKTYAPTPPKK